MVDGKGEEEMEDCEEKMMQLRDELLEVEAKRLLGSQGHTPQEVAEEMRKAIRDAAREKEPGTCRDDG